MSRTLFENSKAALAFAGMTLLGAITMVGTSENDGVLPRVAEGLAEQRAASVANWAPSPEQQNANASATSNAPGSNSVFGDYNPASGQAPSPEAAAASLAQAEAAAAAAAAAVKKAGPPPTDTSMNAF